MTYTTQTGVFINSTSNCTSVYDVPSQAIPDCHKFSIGQTLTCWYDQRYPVNVQFPQPTSNTPTNMLRFLWNSTPCFFGRCSLVWTLNCELDPFFRWITRHYHRHLFHAKNLAGSQYFFGTFSILERLVCLFVFKCSKSKFENKKRKMAKGGEFSCFWYCMMCLSVMCLWVFLLSIFLLFLGK